MSTSSPTTTAEELIAESINIGTSNRIEKNRQELREGAPATVTTKSNNNYNLVKKRKATTTTTTRNDHPMTSPQQTVVVSMF